MRSLTCTTILVSVVHTMAKQAVTSLHECWFGRTQNDPPACLDNPDVLWLTGLKTSTYWLTLSRPGVERTIAAFTGSQAQRTNHWATDPAWWPLVCCCCCFSYPQEWLFYAIHRNGCFMLSTGMDVLCSPQEWMFYAHRGWSGLCTRILQDEYRFELMPHAQ